MKITINKKESLPTHIDKIKNGVIFVGKREEDCKEEIFIKLNHPEEGHSVYCFDDKELTYDNIYFYDIQEMDAELILTPKG